MSDGPVLIAEYPNVTEAHVLISRLEAEGIRAVPHNSESATLLNHLAAGIGGVGVLVAAEHAERARSIAQELLNIGDLGEIFGDETEYHCPECNEPVPADHDVCWSCEADLSDIKPNERATVADEDTDRAIDTAGGPVETHAKHARMGRASASGYLLYGVAILLLAGILRACQPGLFPF